jgi:DNA repair protein RecO (recombination protein O)
VKNTERGLIISRISYSETSLILRCFTENHGMKSFLFPGAKKKKNQLIMPLAPIEFTFYQRNDSQMGKMTDTQLFETFTNLPFHPIKSGIVFFMAEMLQLVLHDDVKESLLFAFVVEELRWLDESTEFTNYPIYWLLELTQFLGFAPYIVDENGHVFDLEDGQIGLHLPHNHTSQTGPIVTLLKQLLTLDKTKLLATEITKTERKELMKLLFDYYQIHISTFRKLKSIEVLESMWA